LPRPEPSRRSRWSWRAPQPAADGGCRFSGAERRAKQGAFEEVTAMATYVLMTKLSPAALADPRGRKTVGREWKKRVEGLCPGLKFKAHYALLGPYDFMDIYEVPDEESAFRVSLLSMENGALAAESWPALAYDDFLEVAKAVENGASPKPDKKKKKKKKR
jgi:uncharacterized protein with GYD domain